MKNCATCGMPLEKKENFALGDEDAQFCTYCVNPDGTVRSGEEIFNRGVQFFLSVLGEETGLAEKIVRKNMSRLSYWREHPFESLQGDIATEEEFKAAMGKLI